MADTPLRSDARRDSVRPRCQPKRDQLLLRQAARNNCMRLANVVPQPCIGQAGFCEMLDPFHHAAREMVSRAQSRLVLAHLVCNVALLEREPLPVLVPAADRKDLAADLAGMRSAALDDVCRRR